MDDRKPEASALPDLAGGVERLENMRNGCRLDAVARIVTSSSAAQPDSNVRSTAIPSRKADAPRSGSWPGRRSYTG